MIIKVILPVTGQGRLTGRHKVKSMPGMYKDKLLPCITDPRYESSMITTIIISSNAAKYRIQSYSVRKKNEYVEVLSESTVLLPVCNYYKRDHQAGQQEQWRNGMDGGSRI